MSKNMKKYLLMAAVVAVLFLLDDSPVRLPKFIFMIGCGLAFSIPRKWSHRILTFAGILLVSFLALGRDVVLSIRAEAAQSPYWEVQAPEQQVVLGGQKVFIRTEGIIGTASFYPGDGTMVAMAHSSEGLETGLIVGMNITGGQSIITTKAMVLMNDEQGVLVGLPEDTEVKSETIALGGTADISVGEEAVVHSAVGGTFEVVINGYRLQDDHQLLVFSPLKSANRIIPGMSGSPIVQNGKLVGLLYCRFGVPFESGSFGMARLAADVYEATVGHTEWDPAMYNISAHTPLAPQLSDDQVREAYLALLEKHEIDLGKYDVIDNWNEQLSSSTPALAGKSLLQACIQNAWFEYGHTTPIPPLVISNQRGNEVLVGFVMEDDSTIVVKYDIYSGGWNKSVTRK